MSDLPPGEAAALGHSRQKIDEHRKQISALREELVQLEGKLVNRDPLLVQKFQKENDELRSRMLILGKALFGLLQEQGMPRTFEEDSAQYEIVRQAAVEFLKTNQVEPELWKDLES